MKNFRYIFILFFATVLLIQCKQDTPPKAPIPEGPPMRNIFGYHIPRGLIKTSENLTDGYIMYTVPNSPYAYLINRKGEVVHQWKANYGAFGGYLSDDGSIVLGLDDTDYPVFGHGGPYGRLTKITWDGKILWDFELATRQQILHHDIAVLPNGNILATVYDAMTYDEALALGRRPDMIPLDGPWLEKIIEIEPQGKYDGKIVWEWHIKDHLIQDYDPKMANYGNPKDHPELLDFNIGLPIPAAITEDSLEILKAKGMAERNDTPGSLGADIYHFNAINYNSDLDQIVVSSPHLNEILVIDHSTTAKEAAGHKGGKSGKGGDFLYRWGNPQNYQRGDSTDQMLFGQHDVRWIENGKPGEGHLTIFNNHPPSNMLGIDDFMQELFGPPSNRYSAIFEIEPPINQLGKYEIDNGKPYSPVHPTWVYTAADTFSFYSPFISGAHRMENGNTFINEGARGRFMEVTPEGETAWEYLLPYRGEIRQPDGEPNNPMFMAYSQFRATFIPANHPALSGKELKPIEPQPTEFKMPPPPPMPMGQ